MKRLFFLAILTSLVGCGSVNRVTAGFTGYTKTCVDGVSYLQFPSGATVQLDLSGRPVACR
jgi:uncharacterized protein YceK